jgi:hypothetical protein
MGGWVAILDAVAKRKIPSPLKISLKLVLEGNSDAM